MRSETIVFMYDSLSHNYHKQNSVLDDGVRYVINFEIIHTMNFGWSNLGKPYYVN